MLFAKLLKHVVWDFHWMPFSSDPHRFTNLLCPCDRPPFGRKRHRAEFGFAALGMTGKRVCPVSNRRVFVFLPGDRCRPRGRSLGKPSPRSAAALRPAAPGSRCPSAAAVTTRQAAANCRARLRGGAARERQHAARGLRKPAPPWAPPPAPGAALSTSGASLPGAPSTPSQSDRKTTVISDLPGVRSDSQSPLF